jgi:DNA-binding beta-propeller fold protein YncE
VEIGGTNNIKVVRTLPVGDEPRGVVITPDGSRAYVALGGEDAVAVVDIKRLAVTGRWPVEREPWHLALAPDGKTLAVANVRGGGVSVLDAQTGKTRHFVRTNGVNLRHVQMSPDAQWAYLPFVAERGFPATKVNIDRGWVTASRLARVPLAENGLREAISLDPRGQAFGDVDGLAISPDGKTIVVTAGGTHEMIVLRLPLRFMARGGPGDHIDEDLRTDPTRFRRFPLGGRPLAVRFLPDGKQVAVANYLLNAVQVVDVDTGQIAKTISLGGPAKPSLARQGEAIFLDATRSFGQWFSCATCHVEGHTNGGSFDTFNDQKYDVLKKTLSLRGVAQTPPYTWHGWQGKLRDGVHESAINSMQGPEPNDADLNALEAYFQTLDWVPSPHRNPDGTLTAQAKRGERVFNDKACQTCHAAPTFTTPGVYDVGLGAPTDTFKGYNPPSLRNVYIAPIPARRPRRHPGRGAHQIPSSVAVDRQTGPDRQGTRRLGRLPEVTVTKQKGKPMSHPTPPLSTVNDASAPLEDLDYWEEFLQARYPREPASSAFTDANKSQEAFRDYEVDVRPSVREFYRLNHRYQTFDFVQAKKAEFLPRTRRTMGIWEAMEYLNTLVDDSDPDTDLTQIEHLMQTGRGDPARRPPTLVHPDRPDPRPGQDFMPVG